MKSTIKELLERITHESGCRKFLPVPSVSILRMSADLYKNGLPPIPPEYVDFLQISNGLIWNGLLMLPLMEKQGPNSALYPGLLSLNSEFVFNPFQTKYLILGIASGELVVYDPEAEKSESSYLILSLYDLRIIQEFESLAQLLECFYKRVVE